MIPDSVICLSMLSRGLPIMGTASEFQPSPEKFTLKIPTEETAL